MRRKADREKIINYIENAGVNRLRRQPTMNTADFLAGAMAALQIGLYWIPADLPADWTLGLIGGYDPIWQLWQEKQSEGKE